MATFTWYTTLPLYAFKAVDLQVPIMQHPSFRILQSRNEPSPNDKNAIGLPVSQNRIIALRGVSKIDEVEYEFLRFQRIVVPQTPGEFDLGASRLLATFPEKLKKPSHQKRWRPTYPSFFNNNFFDSEVSGSVKKLMCIAGKLNLQVKPLPEADKPSDFYGLVGKVEMEVSADKVVLEAGSPINLNIKLSGHSFPEALELPKIENQLPFTSAFKILPNKRLGEIINDTKSFVRTIRPIDIDIKSIPPIRIPYFDPETQKYGLAQNKAISINVTPASELTAFDAIIQGDNKLKNNVEENLQRVFDIIVILSN